MRKFILTFMAGLSLAAAAEITFPIISEIVAIQVAPGLKFSFKTSVNSVTPAS